MSCTYEDGYEDARRRHGRDDCDCDDYADGYSAGLRVNRRIAEERAKEERLEAEAYEQAQREASEREQYEKWLMAQVEAENERLAEGEKS